MDDNQWTIVIATLASGLALLALFVVWRRFGGSLATDSLPRNVQLVVTEVRRDYEAKIEEQKRRFEQEMAELKREHEAVRAADALKIAELQKQAELQQKQVDWLWKQFLGAGGQAPPERTIQELPQMVESHRREMLVAVVDDPGLKMDLAVFRRARIPFVRLRPVTLSGFEVAINRARREGKPFRNIHLSVHTGPDGADFSGELATPEWLSERLRGVGILLIAGCESSEIGDWLAGIADYVVTMTEPVSAEPRPALSDIGIFAEVFWSSVYDGKTATEAFYAALERSPTWIGEIAEIHAGVRTT